MARGKKGKKKKSGSAMSGTSTTSSSEMSHKELLLLAATFAGGSFLGAVLDKAGAITGAIAVGIGVWKKNYYLVSAGSGMMFGLAGKKVAESLNGVEEEREFTFSGLMDDTKENAKGFFKVLGAKFLIPMGNSEEQSSETTETTTTTTTEEEQATSGLHGDENVTYFVNPYTQKTDKVDLSELDKVQQQIAQMNGVGELETSERNF